MIIYLCTFSFACPKEKDTKKKGHRLHLRGYSGRLSAVKKGRNSLRSNRSALFNG